MSLNIYFQEDIYNALTALAGASERAFTLAEHCGTDPALVRLCCSIYAGALADVAVSFGLTLPGQEATLTISARLAER